MAPRIMIREDEEVSTLARRRAGADGVQVLTGHKALRCERDGDTRSSSSSTPAQEKRIGF
jgi:pyruvate/2-oxoglutarate dehydrogenase complex dihydrolipoamide dehydrogenase (E3) component